jgi:transketolase C-terminal domain/subunit
MLYRALDAVEGLRKEGVDVGLINKSTLNVVDEQVIEDIGSTGFVLVVESLNQLRTGLGSKVRLAMYGVTVVPCFLEANRLAFPHIQLDRRLSS